MAKMFSRSLKEVATSLQRSSSTGRLLNVPSPFGFGLQLLAPWNCKNVAHSCMCCSPLGNQPHLGLASRSGLCPVKQEPAPKILTPQFSIASSSSTPPFQPTITRRDSSSYTLAIKHPCKNRSAVGKTSVLVQNRTNTLPGTKGNKKLAERGKLRRPRSNTGESG